MQLKAIGEVLNLSKNVSENGIVKIAKALSGLSASAQASALSMTALSDSEKIAILTMNLGEKSAAQAALGITSVGTASTTATGAVTGLGAALKGMFMTNPFLVIATGVTLAITAISGIKGLIDENKQAAVSAAQEAASVFSSSSDSIQSQINKVNELRTALDSGTLTEQEAYQTKSELLSIQQSLSESYGSQAEGIDLVNGSLQAQIDLLNQLNQEDAQRFLNENIAGNEEIIKKMEQNLGGGSYPLGTYYKDTSEGNAIEKILSDSDYKKFFDARAGADGISMSIFFNGNAEDAKEALNDFMTDVDSAQKDLGESPIFDELLANTSDALGEANDILDTYKEDYEAIKRAQLFSSKDLFGLPDQEEKTAGEWLNNYTDAIKKYNEALATGSESDISKAADEFNRLDGYIFDLLRLTPMSSFIEQFTDVHDQLNEAAISANEFKKALTDISSGNDIQKIAAQLKGANLSDVDFKDAILTGGNQPGEDASWAMLNAAQNIGLVKDATNATSSELTTVVDLLVQAGVLTGELADEANKLSEEKTFASLLSSTEEGSLNEIVDNFQGNISTIQDALSKLKLGEEVDITDLTQQFPELIGQTDTLSDSLGKLKVDELSAFTASYKEMLSEITDPGELAQASEFFQNIIDSVDLSDVDFSNLRQMLFDNLFSGNEGDRGSTYNKVQELVNGYADSVTGKEILLKLSLDPDSANWSMNEWAQRIQAAFDDMSKDISFENVIKDGSELSTIISNYTSEMEGLTAAKEKLTSAGGVLDEEQIDDLLTSCPELSKYVDDLDGGINALISTANNEVLTSFNKQIAELRNLGKDADADALQAYADSVIENANRIEGAFEEIGGMEFETPGIKKIESAQGSKNQGSMYEQLLDYYEQAKDLYKKGLVGTDDFKSIAEIFSPNGMDDVGNFEENMPKIERYMTEDATGVQNFLDDLESKGYATLERMADGTEKWSYNMSDLEAAANDMGMSFEWFMSMFGRLGDYGFANDFFTNIEDGREHLNDLYSNLSTEEEKLSELEQAKANGDKTVTDTVIEEQEAKIASIRDSITATQDLIDQLAARTTQDYETQAESAADTAKTLISQLAGTSNGSVREMIESDIEGLANEYHLKLIYDTDGNIVDVVTKEIEDGQQTADGKPIQVPMNVTTEETEQSPEIPSLNQTAHKILTVDTKLGTDNATSEIESKNPTINAKADVDTSNIESELNSGNYSVNVEGNITSSTLDEGAKIESQETTVDYNKGTQEEPESQIANVNYNLGYQELPLPKTTRVNYELGYQELPQAKTVKVNYDYSSAPSGSAAMGTAHASGTVMDMWTDYRHSIGAYAGGTSQDWALPRDEKALVNEVGKFMPT